MDLLRAVNKVLPKLGESPVTSLDTRNPTVSLILEAVDTQKRDVLLPGWWFNKFERTLYPAPSTKAIAIPPGTLSVRPMHRVKAVVRGAFLIHGDTGAAQWDAPVEVELIDDVAFGDLPEAAAQYIFYMALVETYLTDIGMEAVVQQWQSLSAGAHSTLLSEHLQNRKKSTTNSRRYWNYRNSLRS